ncbi:hypothetical protein U0070_020813 [Myodes glareolus]|uniref:Small ribosomal subunit protein eS25 n=1 Tax=Myodes glareolus TaxID=447135 RepID=A0AAW0H3J0_MYOGA
MRPAAEGSALTPSYGDSALPQDPRRKARADTLLEPLLDDKKKKDDGKLAKKDKGPVNESGGKAKMKKWSKGKVQGKLNNLVLFDTATYDKLREEVPNCKLIPPIVVPERLKVQGSSARAALQELLRAGLLKLVSKHRAHVISTRITKGGDATAAEAPRQEDHDFKRHQPWTLSKTEENKMEKSSSGRALAGTSSELEQKIAGQKDDSAVTRIRTEVAAATTQSTNHYTITASHTPNDADVTSTRTIGQALVQFRLALTLASASPGMPAR